MFKKIRTTLIICLFAIGLGACAEDEGISASGGGTISGDGGASSSQYAGTYRGTMDVSYTGDGIDGSDSLPTTLVINSDGTVILTIDGESVRGVINGSQVEVAFRVTESEDGITCTGDALVRATVSGTSLSGPVSGDAECKLALIKRSATLTGSISARKA